jgi:hypothetical protein
MFVEFLDRYILYAKLQSFMRCKKLDEYLIAQLV